MREFVVGMGVRVRLRPGGGFVPAGLLHLDGKAGVIVATESAPPEEPSEQHYRVRFADGREAPVCNRDLEPIG